jgi:tetratricopeptide (TPR) repeat protein
MYNECVGACEKALKLKPDFALAYNNICSAYNAMEQWQKAADACKKAIEIDPNMQLAKNNLTVSLQHLTGNK